MPVLSGRNAKKEIFFLQTFWYIKSFMFFIIFFGMAIFLETYYTNLDKMHLVYALWLDVEVLTLNLRKFT